MDGSAFDRLTQVVGGSTRRFALRTAFSGAAVAAVGMLSSAASSEAKSNNRCKKKLRKCRKKECPACESLLVGESCETTSQCCGTETNMACSFASGDGAAGTVCCGTNGASCGQTGDCCIGFDCNLTDGQCEPVVV